MRQASATNKTHAQVSPSHLALMIAPLLAITWIPGDRYAPWINFESEAWLSGLLLILAFGWLTRSHVEVARTKLSGLFFFLAVLPWVQWLTGKVFFMGSAWTPSFALAGAGMCMAIGSGVKESRWREAIVLCLFTSFLLGSLTSVLAQSEQFFTETGLLSVIGKPPPPTLAHRPAAFLGQPNLLATLHLMAWIGCIWLQFKKKISPSISLALMCLCLLGVVFCGSRTGAISLFLLALILLLHTDLDWKIRRNVLLSIAAMLLAKLILMGLTQAGTSATEVASGAPSTSFSILSHLERDARWHAWLHFGKASLTQFWTGFGWDQNSLAYLLSPNIEGSPTKSERFSPSHNVLLDLALYVGWPLALIIFSAFILMVRKLWREAELEARLVLYALIPLAVHSQLELPHLYVFFLLPAGLMLGLTQSYKPPHTPSCMPKKLVWALLGLLATGWAITIYDYVNIRAKYNVVRFEIIRIKNTSAMPYPDTLALTHLSALLDFLRTAPNQRVESERLAQMERVVMLTPVRPYIFKLALLLQNNQQTDRARYWLERSCATEPESDCKNAPEKLQMLQELYPEIPHLPWPIRQ